MSVGWLCSRDVLSGLLKQDSPLRAIMEIPGLLGILGSERFEVSISGKIREGWAFNLLNPREEHEKIILSGNWCQAGTL